MTKLVTIARQRRFLSQFASLPFDDAAAETYGELRAALEMLGTPIGPYDLQIAAIALTLNLILVTHNVDEFGRVPVLPLKTGKHDDRRAYPMEFQTGSIVAFGAPGNERVGIVVGRIQHHLHGDCYLVRTPTAMVKEQIGDVAPVMFWATRRDI